MNRRAIDVKLFVRDVEARVSTESLMEKYDLTREQLDEALQILANAGKLPRSYLTPDESPPSEAHPVASTCKRCGALVLADSGECPECLQNEVARLIDEKENAAGASDVELDWEPESEQEPKNLEFEVSDLEEPPSMEAAVSQPAAPRKRRLLPVAAGISFVATIVAAALFYFGIPDFLTELWPTQSGKPWPATAQKNPPRVASASKPSESPIVLQPREDPKAPDAETNPLPNKAMTKEDFSAERFSYQPRDANAEQNQASLEAKPAEAAVPESDSAPRPELVPHPEPAAQNGLKIPALEAESQPTVKDDTDAQPEVRHAYVSPQTLPQTERPDKKEDISIQADQINSDLVKAVKKGNLEQAKSLVTRGGNVNAEDDQGSSLLVLAVKTGNEKMVDFLIKKGADPDRKDKDGFTPLARACETANVKVAELLLTGDKSKGAETLFEACEKGKTRWVSLLLDHGADMNARNQHGATPLMVAAGNGHEPLVELLLSKGADAQAYDNKGYSALAWAYSPTAMNVTPFPVQRKIIRLLKHYVPGAVISPGGDN